MLRVLTYHRVADLSDTAVFGVRSVSATPPGFLYQMQHVASRYHVVSMTQVLASIQAKEPLPEGALLITFDDGYSDFLDFAWPALRTLGLPATVFVPTAFPDHPELTFWWERLHQAFSVTSRTTLESTPIGTLPLGTADERRASLRQLEDFLTLQSSDNVNTIVESVCEELGAGASRSPSVMSWDQLRELSRQGVTIGSHTRSHAFLPKLPPDRIREEIHVSQEDLKREIGYALPILCYPNGDHDETVASIAREEGILLGFTTLLGANDLRSADLLRLRRTDITPRTVPMIFRYRLLLPGTYMDAWRGRMQKRANLRRISAAPPATSSVKLPR